MAIALFISSGLILLFLGAHFLVKNAVILAQKLRVSPFVIGVTVVAFGTGLPELIVSLDAILTNHPDIVIGNIVGSNLVNFLCVLGLTAFCFPIQLSQTKTQREGIVLILSTLLFSIFCFFGEINRFEGFTLLLCLVAFTWFSFRHPSPIEEELIHEQPLLVNPLTVSRSYAQLSVLIILSLIALAVGSHLFVEGSVELGRWFEIPEAVIGLTIVALGTAMPEIATSIAAALQKHSDVVLGNIIGSNIFNLIGISGLTALIIPIEVNPHFLKVDIPFLVIVTLYITLLPRYKQTLGRYQGLGMGLIYLIYSLLIL